MKYATVLGFLAGLAAASPQALRQRTPEERGPTRHHGVNRRPVHGPKQSPDGRVQYSTNWAGAVNHGTGITKVSGVISVPQVKASSKDKSGAAWVGIDGDNCQQALIQTGIDFYGDGSFDAWWEWIPDNVVFFDNFPLSVGDQIYMEIDATSKTTGTAILQNLSTGKKVTHQFKNTPSTLCETDVEWIVEDFAGDLVDFGTITFTNNTAHGSSGTITPAGADVLDIRPDGGSVETSCSISGTDVTCSYV